MAKAKKKIQKKKKSERRTESRKTVLDTFHVFIMIPKQGIRRIYLHDVSSGGLGFIAEVGEQYKAGDKIKLWFYVNPSLRLPLVVRVAHVHTGLRRVIGCEFQEKSKQSYKTLKIFVELLESLAQFIDA